MTKFRTAVPTPLDAPQASFEHDFPARQAREVPEAEASTNPPCFIHSSWRTGKTWFSLLFRHFPETICFYEPFYEGLATLTAAEAVQRSPQSWESGHPSSVPYNREYIPLIRKSGGVRLFRPEMSYDWFIPVGGLRGQLRDAELKYLAYLVRHVQRRNQIPVFSFSRSLGRIRPIQKQLPGQHIVIIRNLWAQWASYLYQRQVGNPYFIRSIFRMIGGDDPFCEYIRDFYLSAKSLVNTCKAAEPWEQQIDKILTLLSDSDLFSIFATIHIYLYINAQQTADLFVDTTKLACDETYRQSMMDDLRRLTGLRLSFADVKENFHFINADPNLINKNHIERHVRIAANILREGSENAAALKLAEQLLEGIYAVGSTNSYLEPARRQFNAVTRENERLRAAIGERDAALASSEARAGAAEARLAEAQAEIETLRGQFTELQRGRDERAAVVGQLEAEVARLQTEVGERNAGLAGSEARADSAEASLAKAQAELSAQLEQFVELGRERDAALATAEAGAGAAEVSLARARAELAEQQEQFTELQRDRGERAAALAELETEAAGLRVRIGERAVAMARLEAEVAGLRVRIDERAGVLDRLHAQIALFRQAAAGANYKAAERDASLNAFELEVTELRSLLSESEAAVTATQDQLRGVEARLGAALEEIQTRRAEFAVQRNELTAAGQIARELMTASTVDNIAPQNQNLNASARSKMFGVSRAIRARAIKSGDRARDTRQWPIAMWYYRKALARDPHDAAIWVQYGHALKEAGHLSEAEAAYRRSLAYAPGVADTHLQLGHVLKLQGRTTAAQTAYLRAFALDPAMPFPTQELAGLGWSALHISRLCGLSGALGIVQLHSLRGAADFARDQRDWPKAARLYGQIVAADPTALDIAVQLGHAHKEMGDIERAAHIYYSVMEAKPLDDDLHLQIGHLEKVRGDFAAAAEHYKAAAEINPGNADAKRGYEALRDLIQELHPKERGNTELREDRADGGQADHQMTDDLRFLDARAGEIYRQLTAALE